MDDREIAEIEAVMRKHLRLVIAMRAGVEHAAGIDGVRQAAMEIAALRSKDREDGARWMRERAAEAARSSQPVPADRERYALNEAARAIRALPLSTEQTEAGDA